MGKKKSLYDLALDAVNRNESLYNNWETHIGAHMGKRWPDSYALTRSQTGSDEPTVLEMADMGESEVSDQESFLADLNNVFRTLAKGCNLSREGDWI